MSQINSIRVADEKVMQMDAISRFFEKHPITRKIIAYVPSIILGGVFTIEQCTSYELLPKSGLFLVASTAVIFFFSGLAESCDRSLKNKKIEHLSY